MNFINEQDLFLLEELVRRNFSSKYKDSVLGILWSLIQPLCIMILLTIVFSTIFKGRVENYPVYILTGKCLYDFFRGAIGISMNALKGNKNILQKTAAPKYIFIVATVISEFINFLITLLILVGVMLVTHFPFYLLVMPATVIPVFSEIMMITGLGFIFSIIRVYFTDIQHLWFILTQLLFYASAIFYPMDIIPEPYYSVMILNPIYWIVEQFRTIVMFGKIPALLSMINLILISAMILVVGIIVFKTFENKVTMRL